MRPRSAAVPLVGVVAILLAWLWASLAGTAVMPSYLAAWLVWAGLPIGALALLLVIEIGGGIALAELVPALRVLARGMPLAALLFIPVLIWPHPLYAWLAGSGTGTPFGAGWLQSGVFTVRAVVYLVILGAMAMLFAADRPLGAHRGAALLGLFVLALVTTLAATDWIMSLDTSLHSGEFGLLMLGMQCCVATAGAALIARAADAATVRIAGGLLAGVSAVWLYLHFMQFLVLWSGDLPAEAAWYLVRDAGAGRTIEALVFVLGALLPVLLVLLPLPAQAAALPLVAAGALVAHMAEALWLVTPALRHHVAVRGPDVLMMIGLGALALGLARLRPLASLAAVGIAARRTA